MNRATKKVGILPEKVKYFMANRNGRDQMNDSQLSKSKGGIRQESGVEATFLMS